MDSLLLKGTCRLCQVMNVLLTSSRWTFDLYTYKVGTPFRQPIKIRRTEVLLCFGYGQIIRHGH